MDSKKVETIGVLTALAAMVGIYAYYTYDAIKDGKQFRKDLLAQGEEFDQSYQRGYLDGKRTAEQTPKKESRTHEAKKAK